MTVLIESKTCVRCNNMVGLSKDSHGTLVSAAAYLMRGGQ